MCAIHPERGQFFRPSSMHFFHGKQVAQENQKGRDGAQRLDRVKLAHAAPASRMAQLFSV